MSRATATIAIAACAIFIAACGGDTDGGAGAPTSTSTTTSSTTTSSTTTTLPPAQTDTDAVRAALPKLADMPAGWVEVPEEQQAGPENGEVCPGVPRADVTNPFRTDVDVTYTRMGSGLFDFGEFLGASGASFDSSEQAAAWFAAATANTSACATQPTDFNGALGTRRPASPGQVPGADEAFGDVTTFTQDGQPVAFTLTGVVARKGRWVVQVTSSTPAEASRWVAAALAKLPAT